MTLGARFFRLLTENELFCDLAPELLQAVFTDRVVTIARFERGETVCGAARYQPAIGFLLRGELQVRCKNSDTVLETLQPTDVFACEALFLGEQALIGEAIASKHAQVAFLSKQAVTLLMERDPRFTFRFIRYLSQRAVFLSGKIGQYTEGSAEKKLAQYLRCGFSDYKTYELDQPMSRLAVSLHISRASLYRAFEALEARGAVHRDGKNVRLVDRAALEQFLRA